ncbi:MAG TPA: hypothetical protein VN426_00200 [Syntrophomonadaceae bacterium]|nr:hypothetical protein [Syntrophomonadaceae bacterium]
MMNFGPWELIFYLMYIGAFAIFSMAIWTIFKIARQQEAMKTTLEELAKQIKSIL